MSRQHRGQRSKYAEERRLVKQHATLEPINRLADDKGVELINHIDLFFFRQGEVLTDPYGRGSLQQNKGI